MPRPNITDQNGTREMTEAEHAAWLATLPTAEEQAAQAKRDAVKAIYAPIEYPVGSGVYYDPRRFADFETIRASGGRGKINRAAIFDAKGNPQPFATSVAIKALVDHIEDVMAARNHAAYDTVTGG